MMSHSVPPELVREIIHFVLSSAPPRSLNPKETHFSTKPNWFVLDALSLTSRTYRALALEAWFYNLYLESPDDIDFIPHYFPDLKARWTRSLHCVQRYGTSISHWDLSGFSQLSAVRLDWPSPTTWPSYVGPHWHERSSLPFLNVSSNVEQLDLRGLEIPAPNAFQRIPNTFRNLKVLKIQQRMIWCGFCHMCRVVRLKDPGRTKIVYEGGWGLPIHYTRILARLEHLETVIITMPNHGSGSTTLGHTTPNPDPDEDTVPNLWSGECDRCTQILHKNDVYRETWAAWKRVLMCGDEVRPPKLRRVEWRFYKADEDEGTARLATFTDFEATDREVDHNKGD